MIFVLGSRGRLGQAICARYAEEDIVRVDRSVYQSWSDSDANTSAIEKYFSQSVSEQSVVYICSGLLDPQLTENQLQAVNYHLPRNVITAVGARGVRVVTFGTAMERTLSSNSYVQSKQLLSQFVEAANAAGASATHVRIHTLYGNGEPAAFMFLGQILNALRTNSNFAMTMGRQLREYHHVDDDALAIRSLIDKKVTGAVELSNGEPITLRSLAEAIFESLGRSHLLKLGALPEPVAENFDLVFDRPEILEKIFFRSAIPSVVDFVKLRLGA